MKKKSLSNNFEKKVDLYIIISMLSTYCLIWLFITILFRIFYDCIVGVLLILWIFWISFWVWYWIRRLLYQKKHTNQLFFDKLSYIIWSLISNILFLYIGLTFFFVIAQHVHLEIYIDNSLVFLFFFICIFFIKNIILFWFPLLFIALLFSFLKKKYKQITFLDFIKTLIISYISIILIFVFNMSFYFYTNQFSYDKLEALLQKYKNIATTYIK